MKLEDKVGLVVLIVGISFILIYPYYKWQNSGKMRYTMGKLSHMTASRNGYQPTYEYSISGQHYSIVRGGSRSIEKEKVVNFIGKNFYIMYSDCNPNYAKILLDYPVPDSIQSAPPFGWDSIPGIGQLENPFVWDAGKSPPIKKK